MSDQASLFEDVELPAPGRSCPTCRKATDDIGHGLWRCTDHGVFTGAPDPRRSR